jgi:hypothetical protein
MNDTQKTDEVFSLIEENLELSLEMAQIDPSDWEKHMPEDLFMRVREVTSDPIDNWYVEDKNNKIDNNRIACEFAFISGGTIFRCYFGFVRASKLRSDTKKQQQKSAIDKFEFCAVSVNNPKDPHKGTWGRNDFEDEDFEKVAKTMFDSAPSRGRCVWKLDTIITKHNLIKPSLDILSLCGYRIKGKLIK